MRFRDLPPIYARLAGFVLGSVAQRVEACLPAPLTEAARQATGPVVQVLPQPLRRGLELVADRSGPEPPVLIVPGFVGPAFLLFPLATFLRLHGRTVHQMVTFPALDGVVAHAERVAAAVERLKQETGAAQVDIVTHSMGGLAGRYYMLRRGGNQHVRRFVSIATPHHGTRWAQLELCQSMSDMKPGNALLKELEPDVPVPGVKCLNIRAGWDQIVWPREHGRWGEHARDHELPFAEHWAVQTDVRLLALVLTELEAEDDEVLEGDISVAGAIASEELRDAG